MGDTFAIFWKLGNPIKQNAPLRTASSVSYVQVKDLDSSFKKVWNLQKSGILHIVFNPDNYIQNLGKIVGVKNLDMWDHAMIIEFREKYCFVLQGSSSKYTLSQWLQIPNAELDGALCQKSEFVRNGMKKGTFSDSEEFKTFAKKYTTGIPCKDFKFSSFRDEYKKMMQRVGFHYKYNWIKSAELAFYLQA